jgi:hypothetical protein
MGVLVHMDFERTVSLIFTNPTYCQLFLSSFLFTLHFLFPHFSPFSDVFSLTTPFKTPQTSSYGALHSPSILSRIFPVIYTCM